MDDSIKRTENSMVGGDLMSEIPSKKKQLRQSEVGSNLDEVSHMPNAPSRLERNTS